jgi:hypothetical protein
MLVGQMAISWAVMMVGLAKMLVAMLAKQKGLQKVLMLAVTMVERRERDWAVKTDMRRGILKVLKKVEMTANRRV